MSEVVGKEKKIHQGKNVRFARELKGLFQQDLADKLNKQQSDISRIENQEIIDDELLNQIALALEIPVDFLKNFNPESLISQLTINAQTVSFKDKAVASVGHDVIYNFPIEEVAKMNKELLEMQKEHYEKEMQLLAEKFELEKENALLKQKFEFLKNKK